MSRPVQLSGPGCTDRDHATMSWLGSTASSAARPPWLLAPGAAALSVQSAKTRRLMLSGNGDTASSTEATVPARRTCGGRRGCVRRHRSHRRPVREPSGAASGPGGAARLAGRTWCGSSLSRWAAPAAGCLCSVHRIDLVHHIDRDRGWACRESGVTHLARCSPGMSYSKCSQSWLPPSPTRRCHSGPRCPAPAGRVPGLAGIPRRAALASYPHHREPAFRCRGRVHQFPLLESRGPAAPGCLCGPYRPAREPGGAGAHPARSADRPGRNDICAVPAADLDAPDRAAGRRS